MLSFLRRGSAPAIALLALFVISASALARPPIPIRTGANTAVDGYLEVRPDEYGGWASNFTGAPLGPNADQFNPQGAAPVNVTAFTSGFFLFGPNNQRELLSDWTSWQNTNNGTAGAPTFAQDTSMNRAIVTPNVGSDSNGDGVADTLNSAFRVFSATPGTDLGFTLRQRVQNVSSAVSFIQQDYTVTNNGTAPITIKLVRAFDGDLLYDGNFETDSVGTGANAPGATKHVFMQEPNQSSQAVTMSMDGASSYYGGKHGVVPPGGAPNFDFGTDTEVWDAMGVPTSWQNLIAGVGYNTDGQSGPSPPGSTAPRDAFMGMDLTLTLNPGASSSFSVLHTYGQTSPIPEPATLGLAGLVALAALRRSR